MPESFVEKRKFGRRAVFKPATVIIGDCERITAIVTDISEGGARIRITDIDRTLTNFLLEIPGDDFVVHCEVVHRLSGTVGVRFLGSPKRLSWQRNDRSRRLRAESRAASETSISDGIGTSETEK